jgi:ATP-dependent DNA helicase
MNKKLQNPVMQLRLACDSPHNFYWPWGNDEAPDSRIISESGKMRLLDCLVPALFTRGHKILIFSQFKTQLDILEDWATLVRGWKVCRIDGQVKQEDRREQIKAFNADPEHKIFLLSTRAGGQGINLAAADTVILFDSDWNPQQDLQAQDRAHRIGQTRPVIVYRLATKGTVEQTLLEKADGKRRLEKLVIQKGKFKSLVSPNNDDIEELQRILVENDFEKYDAGEGAEILSKGDLDVLMDRSDEAYERAEEGLGSGRDFKVVETKREEEGILARVSSK